MKTQNHPFFRAIEKSQLDNLTNEIKETVAADIAPLHAKTIFGAVDYWNLQRMRRSRVVRRHLV